MKTRLINSLKTAYLSLALLYGGWSALAEQPNVILIVTDDQGYGDLSSHGNPVLKTPNMDRLHSQSVRFTDFHVAPMCSPTRGQLMTGLDAMRNGCTAVCQGRSMPRADIPMMANYFEDAGYATGHFGKWHLGDSYPFRPQDRGFQETIHHRAWGITSLADYWENSYFDPVLEHNGVDKKFEGYCTDIFFNESMKWIESNESSDKPFFLYLPTNTPHVPNVCPEEYSAPYTGKSHQGHPAPDTFYGMIANLDENVGKLEAFLEAHDLRDNTILIFMSDNGTQSKQAQALYNAGMRDKKTSVYEGGHRVPCFVRWPEGELKHGTDIDALSEVQDLLPTLIDFCDLKKPKLRLDGVSLAGVMKGTKDALPDRKLVIQYKVSGEPWDPAVVLWDKWRLIGGDQLYHVGDDPGQKADVADQHREIVNAMAAHYDGWHDKAKPLFDTKRWIIIGSKEVNDSTLYAQDWTGDYCDNGGGLTQATAQGYWNVIVDRPGIYQVELRRWPKESNKTLTEGKQGPDDTSRSARPIAAANLRIAEGNYTLETAADATHASFQVKLPAGKTQLTTTLLDAEDRALCSAMYVYVSRVSDDADLPLTPTSTRQPKAKAPVTSQARKAPMVKPAPSIELAEGDRLLTDFEGDSYGAWTATGAAFGNQPGGTRNRVVGHQGKQLVDTIVSGGSDRPVGSLTSPLFTLEHRFLNFLIGGGNHAGKTCLNLLVDGKIVQTATGSASKDDQQRKIMERISWNLVQWKGKEARLVIVDQASGGWGHIMVDHIYFSNQRTGKASPTRTRQAESPKTKNREQRTAGAPSPNFVFILGDDQGWNALSTRMDPDDPGSGSTYYQTPNLAKLASQGMRFSQAYSPAPTCSPTRHAIQFGRSPTSLGIFGADGIRDWDATSEESLAHVLKTVDPNYVCAHLGKWHIGKSPEALGYDISDGAAGNGTGNSKDPSDPKLIFDLSTRSNRFIEEQVKAGKPFYLQISHYANHLKYQARAETIAKYETRHADKATPYQNSSLWAAMNEDMDTGIGMVLDKIDELGIADSTYIIYTADNGYEAKTDFKKTVAERGYYKAFPQRSHKYHVSEGGIRVPFIVRGPGFPANTHSTTPVVGTDIFPTVMELSIGANSVPDRVEGASLVAHIKSGGSEPVDRKDPFLVFKFSKPRPPQDAAIVQGDYKLIKDLDTDEIFLFNLKKDIGERNNLATENPAMAQRLYAEMTAYFKRFNWDESQINTAAGKPGQKKK